MAHWLKLTWMVRYPVKICSTPAGTLRAQRSGTWNPGELRRYPRETPRLKKTIYRNTGTTSKHSPGELTGGAGGPGTVRGTPLSGPRARQKTGQWCRDGDRPVTTGSERDTPTQQITLHTKEGIRRL